MSTRLNRVSSKKVETPKNILLLVRTLGKCTNVILALWTTSVARIRLFHAMKQTVEAPGCRLLYSDTGGYKPSEKNKTRAIDSVILSCPEGQMPVETGEHLGQLKDEYPDKTIAEYVCGGAKQYGLKVCRDKKNVSPTPTLRSWTRTETPRSH